MHLHANPKRYGQAKYQRHHLSEMEWILWQSLRGRKLGPRFHRQKVIGEFIVDFWCPSYRLVIELHSEDFPYPKEREERLRKIGVQIVLNLPNTMPVDMMLERIREAMGAVRLKDRIEREKEVVCAKHPDSGRTNWGTCWACYAEKYRGPRSA